jgi:NAD(P)H-binding
MVIMAMTKLERPTLGPGSLTEHGCVLQEEHAGVASGMLATIQELGNALGIAIAGVIFFGAAHQGIGHAFTLALTEFVAVDLAIAVASRAIPRTSRSVHTSTTDALAAGPDQDAVERAIAGQQAVIMSVRCNGEPDVGAGIACAVTTVMSSHGVSRLVATSAYGLVATRPYVLASLVRRVFGKAFADQLNADNVIRDTARP